jgi:hypothetical protein
LIGDDFKLITPFVSPLPTDDKQLTSKFEKMSDYDLDQINSTAFLENMQEFDLSKVQKNKVNNKMKKERKKSLNAWETECQRRLDNRCKPISPNINSFIHDREIWEKANKAIQEARNTLDNVERDVLQSIKTASTNYQQVQFSD